ncbi:MAG: hypothetical protein Kow0068_07860 [Marinilabiliales bacterium]
MRLALKWILVIPCLLTIYSIKGQNLVPNPGFEKYNKLANIWMKSSEQFNSCLVDWTSPTNTVPDLISLLVNERFWANPKNIRQSKGLQLPHSGNNMIGFRTYGTGDDGAVACWHEYVQVKLTEPLIPGKSYYIEFWVCDALRGVRSNGNIGAYFSDTMINTNNRLPILLKPQINYCDVIESTVWFKISGFYTPDTPKKYLIIGNFYHDAYTPEKKHEGQIQGGYYYLDDVLVRPKQPEDISNSCEPPELKIPPEIPPAKENIPHINISEKEVNNIDLNIGDIVNLDKIFFETDKSELKKESLTELDKLYDLLVKSPTLKIEIHGHTDNVGTDEYNAKLSENRAKAVYNYLVEKGIQTERMSYKGFGHTKPIASNSTEEGRAKNRRVEFVVVSK